MLGAAVEIKLKTDQQKAAGKHTGEQGRDSKISRIN